MDRFLQATASVAQVTFTDANGAPVDPSPASATVTVTRADTTATALYTATAATRTGVGVFTHALTTADTALLDSLTLAWTSSLGTVTTRVEIVGGFLFTVAQAQATAGLTTKTAVEIQEARTYAEDELEQACGVAFVPRFSADTFSLPYSATMTVARPKIRLVRFARSDTTSLAASAIAFTPEGGIDLSPSLPIANSAWWKRYRTITLGYEHGWDAPPPAVSRAALTVARDYLTQGPVADRAIQQATDFGPIYLATPGYRGKRFGIPAVDAVVEAYSYRPPQIHSLSGAGTPPAGTLYPDQFQ